MAGQTTTGRGQAAVPVGGGSPGVDLARVTVTAPHRRAEMALPAGVPVADLLPSILRHCGEALADSGEAHGGWVLRRIDGAPLETAGTLGAQIRDGDILHLVPAHAEWPEPDYDDLADAIAATSRRHAPPWSGHSTLNFGLAVVAAVLAVGLYPMLSYGPGKPVAGAVALGVALLLTLVGIVLARALADARSGGLVAAYALPYAFVGGLLVLPAAGSAPRVSAAHILVAAATLLLFSVLGYYGAASLGRIFVAGGMAGLFAVIGALAGLRWSAAGAAAVLVAILVAAVAGFPLLAMRIAKLPQPRVPQDPADLAAAALPARKDMFIAVVRTDEVLTGLLIGAAVLHVACAAVILGGGGPAGLVLVGVVAVVNLLRARLFATLRHRLPLLIAGLAAAGILAIGVLARLAPEQRLLVGGVVVPLLACLVLAAAVSYSRRPPSPYLGRAAEILDVVLVLAVVPTAAAVLGLFGWIRGLGG